MFTLPVMWIKILCAHHNVFIHSLFHPHVSHNHLKNTLSHSVLYKWVCVCVSRFHDLVVMMIIFIMLPPHNMFSSVIITSVYHFVPHLSYLQIKHTRDFVNNVMEMFASLRAFLHMNRFCYLYTNITILIRSSSSVFSCCMSLIIL